MLFLLFFKKCFSINVDFCPFLKMERQNSLSLTPISRKIKVVPSGKQIIIEFFFPGKLHTQNLNMICLISGE